MDIKTFEELKTINEALSPEERKAKRKARKENKGGSAPEKSKPASSMDSDDDIYDMEELDYAPSKSMAQSVERFRTEQIKFQDLQKEFVLTPKDNIVKRESLKKQLMFQAKKTKAAEADFERIISQEEAQAEEYLLFESLNLTKIINESIQSKVVSQMDSIVKDVKRTENFPSGRMALKSFLEAADDIIVLLYRENEFDYEDVIDYLVIKMQQMHPSD